MAHWTQTPEGRARMREIQIQAVKAKKAKAQSQSATNAKKSKSAKAREARKIKTIRDLARLYVTDKLKQLDAERETLTELFPELKVRG